MKYKHIVFDIDGTLIDTEYAVLHSLQETIKGLSGREIPCSELRFALGITGTDALKKLAIKDTSYAIELWDKNMRNYTNNIKVFDGIVELLKNLLSLDYEMGIVTSKTREEFTRDKVDEYALKYMMGHKINDITEATYTKRKPEWLMAEIMKIK